MADRCDNCGRLRVDGKGEHWGFVYLTPQSVLPQLRCPDCTPKPATTEPTNPTTGGESK